MLYVHRRIGDAEIYFLSNQRDRPEELEAVFRAGPKAPELFDPATGNMVRPGVFRQETDGRVTVPLRLDPNGSVFVVFRDALPARHAVAIQAAEIAPLAGAEPLPSTGPPPVELERDPAGNLRARIWEAGPHAVLFSDDTRVELPVPALPAAVPLDGPWQVSFPPQLGAPAAATFDKLISWTEHAEPGIRFFSGTATYRKEFELPASLFGADRELYLDLGRVEVIARVTLNGQASAHALEAAVPRPRGRCVRAPAAIAWRFASPTCGPIG